MGDLILGSLGFVLFLVSDFNGIKWKNRWLRGSFAVGCLLLAMATLNMIVREGRGRSGAAFFLCIAIAALFLFALLYTLFFAIPFQESYGSQHGGRTVCRRGMYAMCRHPGVLWLSGFYLFLWLALGGSIPFFAFLTFSLWDLGYVIMQDCLIFPELFCDYGDYQKQVPLLVPDKNSMTRCLRTWGRGKGDEI